INQFNLEQVIRDPTHYTESSSSLIDLILCRSPTNVLYSGVIDPFIPNQIRYHCPILVLLKFLCPKPKLIKRKIWYYERADFVKYRDLLSGSDLINKINIDPNIDSNVSIINEVVLEAARKSVPNKVVIIRPNAHPWIDCNIRRIIRKRKRAYRKYKQTSNDYYWRKYKQLRNIGISEIRQAKINYYDKLERQLSTENPSSRLFWKTSKQLLNIDKRSASIPTLSFNGEYAEDDAEKANMLNSYFSMQTVINDQNKHPPQLPLATDSVLDYIHISVQDVRDVLKNLDVKKACGPNHINPRFLKEGAHFLSQPLSVLFNRSLSQGYFPSQWKDGYLTPIHKKDDKSLPSNYRPISLLDPIGKVMERCVHKHLYNYISENHLLTPFQSGFVPGDSTTYQLLHTYHTFCEAVDSGKEVRAVFCDISKAFDRVWHRGLLYKLTRIGCSDEVVKWFTSYLSDRRQCVVLGGASSEWASVHAGVPQGSILGPLLFLLFINDIVKDIHSSIRLFADDTSLYIIVENPQTAALIMNSDLGTISTWATNWLVDFHPRKTVSFLVSKKANTVVHPPLVMNNTILSESSSHKHLGITFSNTCDWTEHISRIAKLAWTRINLLRTLKFRIHRNALERIYFAFIRPLLEYSDSIWDNCSNECKSQ
ncbi:MAG: reverse transcriptase family protein, partial [Shewanella sp.]|nr:reverse transcriptase family protein [Shewanella sp.]